MGDLAVPDQRGDACGHGQYFRVQFSRGLEAFPFSVRHKHLKKFLLVLFAALTANSIAAQSRALEINAGVRTPFRFVAYGDTRFTDPANTQDTNPQVRQELVRAIANAHPAFISFGGDIPLNGFSTDDWKVYDRETAVWRDLKIAVFPALGNHELRVMQKLAWKTISRASPRCKRTASIRSAPPTRCC